MNKKSGMIKGLIIGVILIGLVGGYYYYLTNKREDRSKDRCQDDSYSRRIRNCAWTYFGGNSSIVLLRY